jgi:hypothetical protein
MGEMSWAMKVNEGMIPDWQPLTFWWTIAEVTGPTGIRGCNLLLWFDSLRLHWCASGNGIVP